MYVISHCLWQRPCSRDLHAPYTAVCAASVNVWLLVLPVLQVLQWLAAGWETVCG